MRHADLIGFHTFDYARHFLSCCSRMLGLEHKTNRGSIIIDYYGRDVGIKIMPTGGMVLRAGFLGGVGGVVRLDLTGEKQEGCTDGCVAGLGVQAAWLGCLHLRACEGGRQGWVGG